MSTHRSSPNSRVSIAETCEFDFFDSNNAVIGSVFFNRYGSAWKISGSGPAGVSTPLIANGVVTVGSHSYTFTKSGEIFFSNFSGS